MQAMELIQVLTISDCSYSRQYRCQMLDPATLPILSLNFTDINLSSVSYPGTTFTLTPGNNYYGTFGLATAKTIAFFPCSHACDPPINLRIHVTAVGTRRPGVDFPSLIRETENSFEHDLCCYRTVGYFTFSFFASADGNLHMVDDFPALVTSGDVDTSVINDGAYPTGWNGDTDTAPSRNAVYERFQPS